MSKKTLTAIDVIQFGQAESVELQRMNETQAWFGIQLRDGRVVRIDFSTRAKAPLVIAYDVQDK